MNNGDGIQAGQRVWVLDSDITGGKVWGTISSIGEGMGFFSGADRSVIIVVDGGDIVLSCSEGQRGVRWDVAAPDVLAPAPGGAAAQRQRT